MRHVLHYIRPRELKNQSSWMIIFADLLALLMTFFVMLISMNTIESEKWNSIAGGFSDAFNPTRESIAVETGDQQSQANKEAPTATISLDYLYAVFEKAVLPHNNTLGLHVSRLDNKVVISLPSHFLFDDDGVDYSFSSATPKLSAKSKDLLNSLSAVIEQLANETAIVGHVSPSYNGGSAWVQTIKQASAVKETIVAAGYTSSITIYGLGNSRFEDIDQTIIPEVRTILANRVDIEVRNRLKEAIVDDAS